MKIVAKTLIWGVFFVVVVAFTIHYISQHNIAVLEPKGWVGMQQKELMIVCSLLMAIVVIPVFFMTLFFSWRYRKSNTKAKHDPEWGHSYLAEILWWGAPIIIVTFLALITWRSTHTLSPYKPIESENPPLEIQVVALDWKWLFIYPEQNIATVNYLKFPKNKPLSFKISADAPMNSFWIPQLGGQIYAMPGMRTELHLIANEEGTFKGRSANISGSGFAGMVFDAVATTDEEFDAWLTKVRGSQYELSIEEYHHLVLPSEYDPVIYYSSVEDKLFDKIVKKYMPDNGK